LFLSRLDELIELEPGAFAGVAGPVRYGHEFDDLE